MTILGYNNAQFGVSANPADPLFPYFRIYLSPINKLMI